jgi:hypothetical protein
MPKTKKKQKAKPQFKPEPAVMPAPESYALDQAQPVKEEPRPRVPMDMREIEVNGETYAVLIAK